MDLRWSTLMNKSYCDLVANEDDNMNYEYSR